MSPLRIHWELLLHPWNQILMHFMLPSFTFIIKNITQKWSFITQIGTLSISMNVNLWSARLFLLISSPYCLCILCEAQDNFSSSNVAQEGQKVGHPCCRPSYCPPTPRKNSWCQIAVCGLQLCFLGYFSNGTCLQACFFLAWDPKSAIGFWNLNQ